ncbi:hypothetical protein J6590_001015 [Homalodisca vitripennis]|nr:hypothetical protein J6590_001015 [Homalodisca vitripennis]
MPAVYPINHIPVIKVTAITSLSVHMRNIGTLPTFAITRLRDIIYSRSNLPLVLVTISLEGEKTTSSYGRYDDVINRVHPAPVPISLTVKRSLEQNSRTGMLFTLLFTIIKAPTLLTWTLKILIPAMEGPDILPVQIQSSCEILLPKSVHRTQLKQLYCTDLKDLDSHDQLVCLTSTSTSPIAESSSMVLEHVEQADTQSQTVRCNLPRSRSVGFLISGSIKGPTSTEEIKGPPSQSPARPGKAIYVWEGAQLPRTPFKTHYPYTMHPLGVISHHRIGGPSVMQKQYVVRFRTDQSRLVMADLALLLSGAETNRLHNRGTSLDPGD